MKKLHNLIKRYNKLNKTTFKVVLFDSGCSNLIDDYDHTEINFHTYNELNSFLTSKTEPEGIIRHRRET